MERRPRIGPTTSPTKRSIPVHSAPPATWLKSSPHRQFEPDRGDKESQDHRHDRQALERHDLDDRSGGAPATGLREPETTRQELGSRGVSHRSPRCCAFAAHLPERTRDGADLRLGGKSPAAARLLRASSILQTAVNGCPLSGLSSSKVRREDWSAAKGPTPMTITSHTPPADHGAGTLVDGGRS